MRFFCCIRCKTCWQIGGDFSEIQHIINMLDFEKGSYPCITPHCSGVLQKVNGTPEGFQAKEIPVRAFYRAVHGFGSGDGASASVERFSELLQTKRIVQVNATPVGQPERVILNQLVLDDGTRLHFDSSSRGACCYYIEEPGPSCMEVVDNELSTDTTVEGSNSDREEVGRTPQTINESSNSSGGFNDPSSAPSEQPSAGGMPSVSEADHLQASGTPRDRSAVTD